MELWHLRYCPAVADTLNQSELSRPLLSGQSAVD